LGGEFTVRDQSVRWLGVNHVPDERPRCSAKGCRAPATVDIGWRNPRIHDASRTKHWLACPDHVEQLADFLGRRGFPVARTPVEADES
jgi:hypothetical protein